MLFGEWCFHKDKTTHKIGYSSLLYFFTSCSIYFLKKMPSVRRWKEGKKLKTRRNGNKDNISHIFLSTSTPSLSWSQCLKKPIALLHLALLVSSPSTVALFLLLHCEPFQKHFLSQVTQFVAVASSTFFSLSYNCVCRSSSFFHISSHSVNWHEYDTASHLTTKYFLVFFYSRLLLLLFWYIK